MALDKPYLDIPGTTVFDSDNARQGYHLNQFCMSLMQESNRQRFKENEDRYLANWPMTDAQRHAVRERDFNTLIESGGNIYFIAKIFSCDGNSFVHAAAKMTGMSEADYQTMMVNGGRSPDGNRSIAENTTSQSSKDRI